VFAVHASKEWLLNLDVGVFWVVMRVLACGGLGVLAWEAMTGQMVKRKNIEVRMVPLNPLHGWLTREQVVCVGHRVIAAVYAIWLSIHRVISPIITTVRRY